MKLIQKRLFRGTSTFEIGRAAVKVDHRTLRREKQYSIELQTINPCPTVNKSYMVFHNIKEGGPGLSLLVDNPDSTRFTVFVNELEKRIIQQYQTVTSANANNFAPGIASNVFEEAPVFSASLQFQNKAPGKPVNVENIQNTIEMLQRYLDTEETGPLLDALEKLKSDPESESCFGNLVEKFNELGPLQGAVLTYAPYVGILLSDDPFGCK